MQNKKPKQDPKKHYAAKHYAAHVARIQKALKEITVKMEEAAKVENANWANVGDVAHYGGTLEGLADSLYGRGEFAKEEAFEGSSWKSGRNILGKKAYIPRK